MMDNNTLQALTTLAEKLGTTSEYLWGVLLRQAPITGAITLALMVAWVVMMVFLIRLVRSKTKTSAKTDENRCPSSEWEDEIASLAWGGVIIFVFITALLVSGLLPGIMAALFNPEYWALKQILTELVLPNAKY